MTHETPKLKVYPDMGGEVQAGFMRTDVPMFHSVAREKQGCAFDPAEHWPCTVCEVHGFTLEDFRAQWKEVHGG